MGKRFNSSWKICQPRNRECAVVNKSTEAAILPQTNNLSTIPVITKELKNERGFEGFGNNCLDYCIIAFNNVFDYEVLEMKRVEKRDIELWKRRRELHAFKKRLQKFGLFKKTFYKIIILLEELYQISESEVIEKERSVRQKQLNKKIYIKLYGLSSYKKYKERLS